MHTITGYFVFEKMYDRVNTNREREREIKGPYLKKYLRIY